MKHIVLFGAGKSATCLIDYLVKLVHTEQWQLTVVDGDRLLAESKTGKAPGTSVAVVNIEHDAVERRQLVQLADIVISLLPPHLHQIIAIDCLDAGKHLLTASYAGADMLELDARVREKGLLFLCEMGLDPGIDHMSAMQLFTHIKEKGGVIHSFKSHCGGLVAPESDNNPWHYKISWNPRNVVLAGKAGAVYRENGQNCSLPYADLFKKGGAVEIPGAGKLAWYANRDSLGYIPIYALEEAGTFIRTTLRYPDFLTGWQMIQELNLADETVQYNTAGKTLKQFFADYTAANKLESVLNGLTPVQKEQLLFLGWEDAETLIPKETASAADVLQLALEQKLKLQPGDKDMIVMMHEIEYRLPGETTNRYLGSSLVVLGEDALRTAMAKTVGLPLGIAAKLVLQGVIQKAGVHIPVTSDIYTPVMAELATHGIVFHERDGISPAEMPS
ncbi:MAG: saccharopine dehydrogenase NADP-binding domain-containing protein [Dinghuibacter sp.]|nr:saccharopine dehydrogenase NADP-binding domain-containing protein [Dinghuibacter sp.]